MPHGRQATLNTRMRTFDGLSRSRLCLLSHCLHSPLFCVLWPDEWQGTDFSWMIIWFWWLCSSNMHAPVELLPVSVWDMPERIDNNTDNVSSIQWPRITYHHDSTQESGCLLPGTPPAIPILAPILTRIRSDTLITSSTPVAWRSWNSPSWRFTGVYSLFDTWLLVCI